MAIEEVSVLRYAHPFEFSDLADSLCRNSPLRYLTRKRTPSLAVRYMLKIQMFPKLMNCVQSIKQWTTSLHNPMVRLSDRL